MENEISFKLDLFQSLVGLIKQAFPQVAFISLVVIVISFIYLLILLIKK